MGCKRGQGSGSPSPVATDTIAVAPQGKVLQAAENEGAQAAASARKHEAPRVAEPRISVPAGSVEAGSTPGDKGRDPVLEPANLKVELGPYSIDRLPYPNDPSKPALTGVTRTRAAELCSQAGGRLCTELEWERACRGPDQDVYAGGPAWDPSCARSPESCPSGFGVLGLGGLVREWTASDVAAIDKLQPKAAAVRGARAEASAVDHRCAHRVAVDATASADDLGFRCCHGPANAATLPSPGWQQTFRKVSLSPEQLGEMLSSVPQLSKLGRPLTFFKEPDDTDGVLKRTAASGKGQEAPPQNVTLTTSPLLWNPVPGEEILVVVGRAQKDVFILAFHRLPGERYRIGSSLVLEGEKFPVVLGFNGYVRRKLEWATCWDCPAESGSITYREDNRVVITQK